jgi:hypothetical protein
MIYHLILINDIGIMLEHTMDLPVTPEITWDDFVQQRAVKDLLLENPTMWLQDVTPDGMPDKFTDEQELEITKANNPSTSKEIYEDSDL